MTFEDEYGPYSVNDFADAGMDNLFARKSPVTITFGDAGDTGLLTFTYEPIIDRFVVLTDGEVDFAFTAQELGALGALLGAVQAAS